MNESHLYIVPRADQDDDFMEAVVEVGAQIPPPPPRSNVLSFCEASEKRRWAYENEPVFVPFDEFGKPVWTR